VTSGFQRIAERELFIDISPSEKFLWAFVNKDITIIVQISPIRKIFVLELGRGIVKDLIMPLLSLPHCSSPIVPCDTDTPIPEFIKLQVESGSIIRQNNYSPFKRRERNHRIQTLRKSLESSNN
jgi:hypothetical protein